MPTGKRVRLATGTLYTALDRLNADGHVQLVSEECVSTSSRGLAALGRPPGMPPAETCT